MTDEYHDPFTDGCPECGSMHVVWSTVGYDYMGSIKELVCMNCPWTSEDDDA